MKIEAMSFIGDDNRRYPDKSVFTVSFACVQLLKGSFVGVDGLVLAVLCQAVRPYMGSFCVAHEVQAAFTPGATGLA
jgi:hypothetical protein